MKTHTIWSEQGNVAGEIGVTVTLFLNWQKSDISEGESQIKLVK